MFFPLAKGGREPRVRILDNVVDARVQAEMLLEGRKLVERAARWFVRNRLQPLDITDAVVFINEVLDSGLRQSQVSTHVSQRQFAIGRYDSRLSAIAVEIRFAYEPRGGDPHGRSRRVTSLLTRSMNAST